MSVQNFVDLILHDCWQLEPKGDAASRVWTRRMQLPRIGHERWDVLAILSILVIVWWISEMWRGEIYREQRAHRQGRRCLCLSFPRELVERLRNRVSYRVQVFRVVLLVYSYWIELPWVLPLMLLIIGQKAIFLWWAFKLSTCTTRAPFC